MSIIIQIRCFKETERKWTDRESECQAWGQSIGEVSYYTDLVVWLALAIFRYHQNLSAKSHIWPFATTAHSSGCNAGLSGYATAPHGGCNLQQHLKFFVILEKILTYFRWWLLCATHGSVLTTQECIPQWCWLITIVFYLLKVSMNGAHFRILDLGGCWEFRWWLIYL